MSGAFVALAGVLAGLWISGDRTERQRHRDLHAQSLAAILSYQEMPSMIRRRPHEPEHASDKRIRLAARFSAINAELTTCQVLLAADGNQRFAATYERAMTLQIGTSCLELAWSHGDFQSRDPS